MIEVLAPGIMSSVQDMGRTGARNLGVGVAGAMDADALRIGNLMVGNPENAPAIEVTLGGLSLRFEADTVFALTGADTGATLDGAVLPPWWVTTARTGQVLTLGMARVGMRAMVCIAGGIAVEPVMGSAATDVKGGFGGHEGRWLRAGDRLHTGTAVIPGRTGFGLASSRLGLRPSEGDVDLRVLPAAEWSRHSPQVQAMFADSEWTLQSDSNRMGYRLSGPALLREPMELLSHGIVPGTIQLPPSGQPVIQMVDANTCGGYPKLGVVIGADMSRLGQVRLGGRMRFHMVDRATALAARTEAKDRMTRIARWIALARGTMKG